MKKQFYEELNVVNQLRAKLKIGDTFTNNYGTQFECFKYGREKMFQVTYKIKEDKFSNSLPMQVTLFISNDDLYPITVNIHNVSIEELTQLSSKFHVKNHMLNIRVERYSTWIGLISQRSSNTLYDHEVTMRYRMSLKEVLAYAEGQYQFGLLNQIATAA